MNPLTVDTTNGVGYMARNLLSQVLATPEYARLRDEDKKDLIDEILRKSRGAGRGRTLQQSPDLVHPLAARLHASPG